VKFIDSSSIGAISSLMGGSIINIGSGVFSMIFGSKKNKKLTKAQRKKLASRRYRVFVDNIVMHHKRLHDRNREVTVNLTKANTPGKDPKKSQYKLIGSLGRPSDTKWRDRYGSKERGGRIRGRIDARRIRARSRWVSMVDESTEEDDPSRYRPLA
jgi:hypothetical protein